MSSLPLRFLARRALGAAWAVALLASCSAPSFRQRARGDTDGSAGDGMDASVPKDASDAAAEAGIDGGSLRATLDRLSQDLRRKRISNADLACQPCEKSGGYSAQGILSRSDCMTNQGAPPSESKASRKCKVDAYALDPETSQTWLEIQLNIENEWSECLGLDGTCDLDEYNACATAYDSDFQQLPVLSVEARDALDACWGGVRPSNPDAGIFVCGDPTEICLPVQVSGTVLEPCCVVNGCGLDMDRVVNLTGGPWRGCNQIGRPGVASPSCSLALDGFDDRMFADAEADGVLTVDTKFVKFRFPGCCTPNGECGALSDDPGSSPDVNVAIGLGCIPLQDLTIDWHGGVQPAIRCNPVDGKVRDDAGAVEAGVPEAGVAEAGL